MGANRRTLVGALAVFAAAAALLSSGWVRPIRLLSGGLILAGLALLATAWRALHSARRRGVLAVRGPYSFSRHPQYGASFLIVVGVLLESPTVATLVMFALLMWCCVQLARREEDRMAKEFGTAWQCYAYGRPAFVPRLSRVRAGFLELVKKDRQR